MPRPRKKGLDYFPLDSDFFEDQKIKILKARYGADGVTIYLYLLCEIYKNGFFIHATEDFYYVMSDDLRMDIVKIRQVLNFLLERSLFDNTLFQSDKVLTSIGIQRRYQAAVKERAKKTPVEVGGYWLLEKNDTEPFIKCALFESSSRKNEGFSRNNEGFSRDLSLKKRKVKKSIVKESIYYANPDLDKTFQMYIAMRNSNQKVPLSDEQIEALKEELDAVADTDEERTAACKRAFAGGWRSFWPLRDNRKKEVVSGEEARSRSEWRKAQGTQRAESGKESEESDWFCLE